MDPFLLNLPTLLYHAVFSTKGQAPLVTPEIQPLLHSYIHGLVEREGGWVLESGGMPDHIHLLAHFSPNNSIEEMIVTVKSESARWLNDKVPFDVPFAWQESYAVVTVSQVSAMEVCELIRNQARIHRNKSFKQEFIEFLEEHDIEFEDDETLWE